ncbi:MAG TPA: DUF1659 domain-containing protein [Candidatus Atribacteria bacterium]|mgnify:CR=1 FL=1|nr:DUF1659 domain-containing protein [Candidatus Atribacteria bacterium]HPT78785.1 DUF1659 domain-containing protein [Candidatus Atribacteria bacterium]
MALESRPLNTRLQLQLDLGQNEDGRRITRTRTYSSIDPEATDQDVYDVAMALAGLQSHGVIAVRKVDQTELIGVEG